MPETVVIYTNLIFSALIPKASRIRDLLFESEYNFIAPNFLISEIYKHKEKLVSHSTLDESGFYLYFNSIIERVKFIPLDFISIESR